MVKTKEKILLVSNELFNRNGVQAITTNHIAKALKMSPGNLYFHYHNKEEILQELFRRMCKETYSVWKPRSSRQLSPLEFIAFNYDVYWKYRFFHREMYSLRRRDPILAKMWKKHIFKMMGLMKGIYKVWVKKGILMPLSNLTELTYVAESLLAMSTTYLQFFENAERIPNKAAVDRGQKHVARMLFPYTLGETRDSFEKFLNSGT
ncbi:MAG: TetR/AcrR family transcriptional regulator [Bdellovibrionales bacterium]|jgi:AcrR family transcriptional regulator